MKNILPFIFLFCFSSSFAQENEPCENYSENELYNFYYKYIETPETMYLVTAQIDSIYIFFEDKNKDKITEAGNWAIQNGFNISAKEETLRGEITNFIIIKRKIFEKISLEQFIALTKSIEVEKNKLNIENCGGMGVLPKKKN